MTSALAFIHVRSPLHAGTGRSLGAIDLPIAREVACGAPYIPGSSFKGSLRALADADDARTDRVFGPDTIHASDRQGALAFGDARLLAMPVRSITGPFFWVTSPYLIGRFYIDAAVAGLDLVRPRRTNPTQGTCYVTVAKFAGEKLAIEDWSLSASQDAQLEKIAEGLARLAFTDAGWQDLFTKRLVCVSDEDLTGLLDQGTEVITRVAIDKDTGTAKEGHLWTEECLPAESLLYSLVSTCPTHGGLGTPEDIKVVEGLTKRGVQLGGKATVGRGRCTVRWKTT